MLQQVSKAGELLIRCRCWALYDSGIIQVVLLILLDPFVAHHVAQQRQILVLKLI
jgi:hypothetical protein